MMMRHHAANKPNEKRKKWPSSHPRGDHHPVTLLVLFLSDNSYSKACIQATLKNRWTVCLFRQLEGNVSETGSGSIMLDAFLQQGQERRSEEM